MNFRVILLTVFLVPLSIAWGGIETTKTLDCTREDSCFGSEPNCNPDSNCTSVFQFEEDGSMNLILRNFYNRIGYAAFAVKRYPDETIEYFICLPNQRKILRAIAELGGVILITEQNLTGSVEKLGFQHFRCHFDSKDFPTSFRKEQIYFLATGTYDEVMVIFDGDQMYNLDLDDESDDYEEEEEEKEEEVVRPIAYIMGYPVKDTREVISPIYGKVDSSEELVRVARSDMREMEDDKAAEEKDLSDSDDDDDSDETPLPQDWKDEDEENESEQKPEQESLHKPKARPIRYEKDKYDDEDEDQKKSHHNSKTRNRRSPRQ